MRRAYRITATERVIAAVERWLPPVLMWSAVLSAAVGAIQHDPVPILLAIFFVLVVIAGCVFR